MLDNVLRNAISSDKGQVEERLDKLKVGTLVGSPCQIMRAADREDDRQHGGGLVHYVIKRTSHTVDYRICWGKRKRTSRPIKSSW